MSFKTEILADSLNPQGDRITTMKITFPRFILAEFNTHRMFSRNSASSRAIPFNKMVKMVQENPFIPIAWQKDHKGMQGTEYFTDEMSSVVDGHYPDALRELERNWLKGRDKAVETAVRLNELNLTKQLCNRLLEPFMWHTVIVTATEFENFFNLRCPQYQARNYEVYKSKKDFITDNQFNTEAQVLPDYTNIVDWLKLNKSQAEIHIQAIAELMWDAMNENTPKQLKAGEWHIPFGDNIDENPKIRTELEILSNKIYHTSIADSGDMEMLKVKIATARCARISYQTLGDNPKIDYESDIRLHDILVNNGHASPLEHCARAMDRGEYAFSFYKGALTETNKDKDNSGWCRNFKGFIQYRHLVEV